MMDGHFRGIVQKADKYSRNRNYLCIYPGCKQKAIRSHAIQRAACIEALADNGLLYTRRQSLNSVMVMNSPTDPPDVIELGVGIAGTFNGYCPAHDAALFASAETTDANKRDDMFIAMHLRAISVEYCRKRQVLDFWQRLAALTSTTGGKRQLDALIDQSRTISSCFEKVYLGSLFNMYGGSRVDKVGYYCLPFLRNLEVSCCGCFDAQPGAFDSVIAYNLISYADVSLLVLTNFDAFKHYLDTFLQSYKGPTGVERMTNDIAFWHCEEPLIAARLWRALSEADKLAIRNSLRHPNFRTGTMPPRIVRVAQTDLVTNLTPAILTRLRLPLTL